MLLSLQEGPLGHILLAMGVGQMPHAIGLDLQPFPCHELNLRLRIA